MGIGSRIEIRLQRLQSLRVENKQQMYTHRPFSGDTTAVVVDTGI